MDQADNNNVGVNLYVEDVANDDGSPETNDRPEEHDETYAEASVATDVPPDDVARECLRPSESLQLDSFFSNIRDLQYYVGSIRSGAVGGTSADPARIKAMVNRIDADMNCMREFCEATQAQMETVRSPIQSITEELARAAATEADTTASDETQEQLSAVLRHKNAQAQLAAANAALLKGAKMLAETEAAAAEARLAVIQAVENAKRVQFEAEMKRKTELEAQRVALEAQKAEEARRREYEAKLAAQVLLEAELLRARAEAGEQEIEPFMLSLPRSVFDFDGGIGCIIYSKLLTADLLNCESVKLIDAAFDYVEHQELVSHLIRLSPVHEAVTIRSNLKIAIPHGLTRHQAAAREVIVKFHGLEPGGDSQWTEIPANDTTIDGYKDLKFAEIDDVKAFGMFAVVSRFKLDKLRFKKHGGTTISNIDERVEFIYEPDTFALREKPTIEFQPVDSSSLTELKRTLDVAKGLLNSTVIVRAQWRNKTFDAPLVISLPLPPNPIVARKLAAERSAKEGKKEKGKVAGVEEDTENVEKSAQQYDKAAPDAKSGADLYQQSDHKAGEQSRDNLYNQVADEKGVETVEETEHIMNLRDAEFEEDIVDYDADVDEESITNETTTAKTRKDEEYDEKRALLMKPVKWYMGKYAEDAEDEKDQLFFVRFNDRKGRWTVEPCRLSQGKYDTVLIELNEPIEAFVVFRTSINVLERDVERIADSLDFILSRHLVQFVVRQNTNDPRDTVIYISSASKIDKALASLAEGHYSSGPRLGDDFLLKEGDRILVSLRGNIRCEDENQKLEDIFAANLHTRFNIPLNANDIFVQKSYSVYRGFVLLRRVYEALKPAEVKKEKSWKGGASGPKKPRPEEAQEDTEKPAEGGTKDKTAATATTVDANLAGGEVVEAPQYETKYEVLSQLLITFPKDKNILRALPPLKVPITYHPAGDKVTPDILYKLAEKLRVSKKWKNVAKALGLNRNIQAVVRRNGRISHATDAQVRYTLLLEWVKTLMKGQDKIEILNAALTSAGCEELISIFDETRMSISDSAAALLLDGAGPTSAVHTAADRSQHTAQFKEKPDDSAGGVQLQLRSTHKKKATKTASTTRTSPM